MQNQQPSALRSVLWWLVYAVCGVWGMSLLPGVDFLLPGVLCSMQEGNRQQTLWLVVLFSLVHEGAGLLAFGPAVLWYAMAALLFQVGRSIFEAENVVFVLLFSMGLGVWHVALGIMMRHLQDLVILLPRLLVSGALNAVCIPVVWVVVHFLRQRELRHVNPS